MTLHQLLTHTSVLPRDAVGEYDTVLRDETVKRILPMPLAPEPGKQFIYSNADYNLLGAIIE